MEERRPAHRGRDPVGDFVERQLASQLLGVVPIEFVERIGALTAGAAHQVGTGTLPIHRSQTVTT